MFLSILLLAISTYRDKCKRPGWYKIAFQISQQEPPHHTNSRALITSRPLATTQDVGLNGQSRFSGKSLLIPVCYYKIVIYE